MDYIPLTKEALECLLIGAQLKERQKLIERLKGWKRAATDPVYINIYGCLINLLEVDR